MCMKIVRRCGGGFYLFFLNIAVAICLAMHENELMCHI